MTLKNSILTTASVLFGVITLATGFVVFREFGKLISMKPITSITLVPGQEAHSSAFTLPKSNAVVVGLRYSLKSNSPNTPRGFSLPFEYRITEHSGAVVSTQAVTVDEGSGNKHMYSFSESAGGWSSSATALQPSIPVRPNVSYRVLAKVSIPDSAQYSSESLELRIYDGSGQIDILRLTLVVVGATLSGLIFLGTSIALWLSTRKKQIAVNA